ncbi:MAG TPA: dihydropteroate synthase, partial [Cytophagales bacterium]|nr:dihydropteroate synthase [Cytophagales bacterium]
MTELGAKSHMSLNIKGRLFTFEEVRIMGILNVTPDSFFDGNKYATEDQIRRRIHQIVTEGADIIDVGGQSTRPGAAWVSEDEELFRVIPVIISIKELYPD